MKKGHIPKTIAKGFFLLGCGSIIFSLPHFITGKYEYGQSPENICPAHEECENVERSDDQKWMRISLLHEKLIWY